MSGEGPDAGQVIDNAARRRFELHIGDQIAFADYRRDNGRLIVLHVETPPNLRGGGVAAAVMQGLLEAAQAAGEKVTPVCPYAAVYIRRHPEYQGLLA